jgi:6-phosphofructokinase 2
MQSIITLTLNPTIDKSTEVDSVASEIKLRCAAPTFDPGGGGINVSRAIHKLGGSSEALYTCGGPPGEMLNNLLEREGLSQRPLAIDNLTRENLTVFETTSNLQYRFGMPGPDLTESEWQACIDAVLESNADYVVASGSLPPGVPDDFYATLATQATENGSRVIIDTSGDALQACRESRAYLMKPNLRELQQLAGRDFSDEEDIIRMARDLIGQGMAEALVISMGAQGATLVTADDSVQMRPPVVPIKSKVGAGDSMVGGMVRSLADGDSLRDAVRHGIAAGTAAVMTPGTELCRKDDAENLFGRIAVIEQP